MIKQNFSGREFVKKFGEANKLRPNLMKEAITSDLERCKKPGIPAYTQVELYEKFAPCLDVEDRAITGPKPSQAVYDAVKKEGKNRKKFKLDLIEKKRRIQSRKLPRGRT